SPRSCRRWEKSCPDTRRSAGMAWRCRSARPGPRSRSSTPKPIVRSPRASSSRRCECRATSPWAARRNRQTTGSRPRSRDGPRSFATPAFNRNSRIMDQNLNAEAVTLTKTFCAGLAATRLGDLSVAALRAARRGVLDWIGCALAGSGHKTITTLLDVLQETSGRPQATVLGRNLRLGLLDAPLANGQMGHVLDYDDTHMGGVVLHTSSPVLGALFALAERAPVSGADFMLAYAMGFEAGVRSGRTAPGHHKGGWHLTGTLGSIAAGAAAGKLLRLDRQRLAYAMGIAATQAGGLQQNRGTMCKSFHAGKAAANGVLAALLAERGFDKPQEIIEGEKGFCRTYSDVAEPERLTEDFGNGWLIETNGHKPYACGVVLHPLIDAVIAIRDRQAIDPAKVDEIGLRVHPLVLSITGVREPATGLQSKFSMLHAAAAALIDGAAGVAQFSD